MPVIHFAGKQYALEPGENLLSGLLRQQAKIPFSCRAGVCQSCILKLDQGDIPNNSQLPLNTDQMKKQCFLACQSSVQSDLSISIPERNEIPARIVALQATTATQLQLILSTRFPFNGKAGDLVLILSQTGHQAQLPIATINSEQNTIEFIITRKAGDEFSRSLHDSAQTGDAFILMRV